MKIAEFGKVLLNSVTIDIFKPIGNLQSRHRFSPVHVSGKCKQTSGEYMVTMEMEVKLKVEFKVKVLVRLMSRSSS